MEETKEIVNETIDEVEDSTKTKTTEEELDEFMESTVSMADILEAQTEHETEKKAILGASDDKCCSYAQGYVKRQALYSCLTCTPEAKTDFTKSAGICLACSYHCHENHDLVELYTKRRFRCDCGSPTRIPQVKCTLDPVKFEKNDLNTYNQNFSGLYCTCHRPYPDLENPIEDEMIQCIICEDWYHSLHLNSEVPVSNSFEEMICDGCMDKTEFLKSYSSLMVQSGKVDVESTEEKPEIDGEPSAKQPKLDETECKRPKTNESSTYVKGATFWSSDWRKDLCKCSTCSQMYSDLKIEYLLDMDDTVLSYEERGKNNVTSTDYDLGMKALGSLGRVKEINAITQYNIMKDKLKVYLHSFAANNQVVTEDDINRFFRMMKEDKSAAAVGGPPNSCR